jgi:hypothetical protein
MPGEVDVGDCIFFGLHTILFVRGGMVADFGASSFGFHTVLFFLGGVGTTFGVSSLICFIFFYPSLFSLFFLMRLSSN